MAELTPIIIARFWSKVAVRMIGKEGEDAHGEGENRGGGG